MGLDELFPVMDAIFDHLRTWDLAKLRKLRTMLFQQTWHPLAHSVGNWAGLRCYFDALEAEATQRGGGNGGEDGGGKPGFGAAAGLDATHGNADALGDVKAEQDVGGSGNVIGVRAPVSRKPGKKRARKGHSLGLQVPPSNQLNGTRGWQNEIRTLPLGNEEPPAPRSGLTETVSAGERSPGAEVNSVGFDKLVFGASGVQPTGPAHPPGAAFAPFELWGQETMEMLDMDLGQQGPSETQLRAEDVHFGLERMDSLSVLLEQGPLPDLEETLNGPSATLDDACAFDFGAPVRAVRVEEGQLSQDGEFRWLLPLDQIQVPAPGAFDTATYNPSAGAWYVDEQTGSGLRNGGRNPTASGMPRRNERNELLDAAAPFLPPRETAPADQTGFQPVPLEQRLADILRSRGAAPVPVGSRGSAPPWPESGGATTPSPTFQRTNARNARQGLAPPVELRSLQPGRRAAPSLSPATSLVNRKPEGAPPKRGILVPAGFRIPRLLLRGVEFFSVKGPDKGKRGVRLPPTPNRAQSAPVGSELRSPGSGPHRRRASTGTGTIPPTEGTRSWGQEKSESFPVPRIPGPRNVDKQNGGPDSPVERATLQDRAHSAPAGLEFLQPKPPQTRLIQSGPDPERASAGVGITPSPGAKYTGGRGRSEPFPVPRSPVPSAHVKAEPSVERAQAEPKASGKPPVRRELPQEQGFRRENVNAPLAGGGAFADGVSGGVQIPRTTGVQDRPPPRGPAQTLSTSGPRDGVRAGVLTVLAASDGVPASVPVPRAIRSVPLVSRADGTAELGPASSSDGTDAAHVRPDPVADGTNGSLEGTGAESDGADGGGDETDNDSDAKSADGEESVGDASDFADGAENTEGCGCTDGEASQDAVEVSDDADDSAAALGATGEREAHANEPDSAGDLGNLPFASALSRLLLSLLCEVCARKHDRVLQVLVSGARSK